MTPEKHRDRKVFVRLVILHSAPLFHAPEVYTVLTLGCYCEMNTPRDLALGVLRHWHVTWFIHFNCMPLYKAFTSSSEYLGTASHTLEPPDLLY